MKKKLNTRQIRKSKGHGLSMLTCYDFQTAQALNETDIDLLLVGDSLGNVVLGFDTTIPVSVDMMKLFSRAVKRGAPDKFVVADLPFGSYASFEDGLKNSIDLFQTTEVEALKLEGAYDHHFKLIERLTQNGIAIMGHIGLTPQSVHQQGGYYTHGKNDAEAKRLLSEAKALEQAGAFAVVLECVEENLAQLITQSVSIPTIGIGSGTSVDGQVLVFNDLLKAGKQTPPSFCKPLTNIYDLRKEIAHQFIEQTKANATHH